MKKDTNKDYPKTLLIAINFNLESYPTNNIINRFYDNDYIFINVRDKKIELSNSRLCIPSETDMLENLPHLYYYTNPIDTTLKTVEALFYNLKEHLLNYDMLYIAANRISEPYSIFLRLLLSYSYEISAITAVFVLEQFWFEGKHLITTTENGISILKKYANITVTISANSMFQDFPKGTNLPTAICTAECNLYQCIENFNEFICNLGQNGVDVELLKKSLIDKEPNFLGKYSSIYINQENFILSNVLMDIENDIARDIEIEKNKILPPPKPWQPSKKRKKRR